MKEPQRCGTNLLADFLVQYDDAGSIGKRYRRQDEIGTPFCITVDHQSLEENSVTVRYRDTATQERIEISRVREFLASKLIYACKPCVTMSQ